MNKILLLGLAFLCLLQNIQANGICIVSADNDVHLPLIYSNVDIKVNNQIATATITQTFVNNTGADTLIKFGFPMTETASALQLRWNNFGEWFVADFSPTPQDTIIPGGSGGGNDPNSPIVQYLGDYPLYFDLEQYVPSGGEITFEITYVDLLPYAFNVVKFLHKNDYSNLQTTPLDSFDLRFSLFSDRTIDWVELVDIPGAVVVNNGNEAVLTFSEEDFIADQDIEVEYQLSADELGLFSFSTFIADTLLHCDEDGEGFMAFIVEPDPSENTEVIEKKFTLIIDQSGSMSGSKMQQARDAASFIVEHLNDGDEFNIIAFSSGATAFESTHVPYNLTTQTEALDFISGLDSGGGTNISGAFSEAIPQFENSDPEKAKIIIFFTDGEATNGITGTQGILDHVSSLVASSGVADLSIFTFGIGASANQQLLTLLALQNNGLAEFLGAEELLEKISNFYLTIQNPVLLNTEMFFDPSLVVESYPNPLPNLFKGQQLIVVGRYAEPDTATVHFSGTAFGDDVSYEYGLNLSDTLNTELQFLPRLWAKRKMENLFVQFYSADAGSTEAEILEDSITNISLCYGVISPFTSFADNSGGGGNTTEIMDLPPSEENLIVAYPNPFSKAVQIYFDVPISLSSEKVSVEIRTVDGLLVQQFWLPFENGTRKQIVWDGRSSAGTEVAQGVYFIVIKVGGEVYRTRVVKS